MIENWKLYKVYNKRTLFFCPWHESQKGTADLDVTIEGPYSGKYFCYGCHKCGEVPMSDVEKLRKLRGQYKNEPTNINWSRLNQTYISQRMLNKVSSPLKVNLSTMIKLEWGWDSVASTFPERNEKDEVIGILRRFPDRNKGVVSGSKRGITIPRIKFDPSKKLHICEGCSDLSVILECKAQGIARPNSNSCNKMIISWCCLHNIETITIIGDCDRPGMEGAVELKNKLDNVRMEYDIQPAFKTEIKYPEPFNDLYDFYCDKGLEEVKKWLS